MPAAYTQPPSAQVSDFRDNCLLIRHTRLICGSCSSGQRFAFGFLPTSPHDDAVAVRLTLPPDGQRISPPSGHALPEAPNKKPASSGSRNCNNSVTTGASRSRWPWPAGGWPAATRSRPSGWGWSRAPSSCWPPSPSQAFPSSSGTSSSTSDEHAVHGRGDPGQFRTDL